MMHWLLSWISQNCTLLCRDDARRIKRLMTTDCCPQQSLFGMLNWRKLVEKKLRIIRHTRIQRCWVFLDSPVFSPDRSMRLVPIDWTSDHHQNTATILWIVLTPETTDGFKCNEVNSQAFAFNDYWFTIHTSNARNRWIPRNADFMTSHAVASIS